MTPKSTVRAKRPSGTEERTRYPDGKGRCQWLSRMKITGADWHTMVDYHDNEWSPNAVNNDNKYLFEMLTLSGAQAGLSWSLILQRRESYRSAFQQWDVEKIAEFTQHDVNRLMQAESGIIRNKLKIIASIHNARIFSDMFKQNGTFLQYLLLWCPKDTVVYENEPPVESSVSKAISKDLRDKGFKFVGPVIVQAFLLSVGLMKGHDRSCQWGYQKRLKKHTEIM